MFYCIFFNAFCWLIWRMNRPTVFTRGCHLSLFWARLIQFMPFHNIYLTINVYPSCYAWLFQVVSYLRGSSPKRFVHFCCAAYVPHAHRIILDLIAQILCEQYESWSCTLPLFSCTRWFKYDRDWFVCKQAALRSSCATLREWSHNLHPPSCSG